MSKYNLVVTTPFADYTHGQVISDDAEIEKVLAKNARFVVRITRVETSTPDPVKPVDPVAGGTPAQAPAPNQVTDTSSATSK